MPDVVAFLCGVRDEGDNWLLMLLPLGTLLLLEPVEDTADVRCSRLLLCTAACKDIVNGLLVVDYGAVVLIASKLFLLPRAHDFAFLRLQPL
jgi:hypothetical protein